MELIFKNQRCSGGMRILDFIILQREGDYERAHSRDLSRHANRWMVSYLSFGTEY